MPPIFKILLVVMTLLLQRPPAHPEILRAMVSEIDCGLCDSVLERRTRRKVIERKLKAESGDVSGVIWKDLVTTHGWSCFGRMMRLGFVVYEPQSIPKEERELGHAGKDGMGVLDKDQTKRPCLLWKSKGLSKQNFSRPSNTSCYVWNKCWIGRDAYQKAQLWT